MPDGDIEHGKRAGFHQGICRQCGLDEESCRCYGEGGKRDAIKQGADGHGAIYAKRNKTGQFSDVQRQDRTARAEANSPSIPNVPVVDTGYGYAGDHAGKACGDCAKGDCHYCAGGDCSCTVRLRKTSDGLMRDGERPNMGKSDNVVTLPALCPRHGEPFVCAVNKGDDLIVTYACGCADNNGAGKACACEGKRDTINHGEHGAIYAKRSKKGQFTDIQRQDRTARAEANSPSIPNVSRVKSGYGYAGDVAGKDALADESCAECGRNVGMNYGIGNSGDILCPAHFRADLAMATAGGKSSLGPKTVTKPCDTCGTMNKTWPEACGHCDEHCGCGGKRDVIKDGEHGAIYAKRSKKGQFSDIQRQDRTARAESNSPSIPNVATVTSGHGYKGDVAGKDSFEDNACEECGRTVGASYGIGNSGSILCAKCHRADLAMATAVAGKRDVIKDGEHGAVYAKRSKKGQFSDIQRQDRTARAESNSPSIPNVATVTSGHGYKGDVAGKVSDADEAPPAPPASTKPRRAVFGKASDFDLDTMHVADDYEGKGFNAIFAKPKGGKADGELELHALMFPREKFDAEAAGKALADFAKEYELPEATIEE